MDEQLMFEPLPPKPPTARLTGAFALAHFPFSILSVMALNVLSIDDIEAVTGWVGSFLVPSLILMALYLPLGLLFGAAIPWARINTAQELGRAIWTQAVIAWGWALTMLWSIFFIMPMGIFAVFLTFFLAFPSSLFVLSFSFVFAGSSLSLLLGSMMVLAIPAGLLPPLLFNLGSFCATRWSVEIEISR